MSKTVKQITDTNSVNFIERELKKRLNINIYSSEYVKYNASDRTLELISNRIIDIIKKLEIEQFPFYILLNTEYTDNSTKHATLIVITKISKKYYIGFYDSNGPLNIEEIKNDQNIHKILTYISKNLNTEYYEFMENKKSINSIGIGNCDALCLWFVYINKDSKNKTEIVDKFNEFYMEIKDNTKKLTMEINKQIVEMSKNTKK